MVSTYKDKNVWFYDETVVANGLWAVVVMKAVNRGPGTDWMGNTITFGVYDQSGVYEQSLHSVLAGAEYDARWEFCGCSGSGTTSTQAKTPQC